MWIIYVLINSADDVFYVGATNDRRRRYKEHRRRHGRNVIMREVDRGYRPEERDAAESRWIESFRKAGSPLINQIFYYPGGRRKHSITTLKKISASQKGRPKPEGFGEKLSAITIGKPHNWSQKGLVAAQATQFKKGRKLDENQRKMCAGGGRNYWSKFSQEERSRRKTEMNLAVWARRSPEERIALSRKIEETKARNRAARSAST